MSELEISPASCPESTVKPTVWSQPSPSDGRSSMPTHTETFCPSRIFTNVSDLKTIRATPAGLFRIGLKRMQETKLGRLE